MWALSTMGNMPVAIASNKRCQELGDCHAMRFQMSRMDEKRIKLGNPAPPTPTKEEIIKLERAKRGGNPTCLHFGFKKEFRECLYPNYYLCAHCDNYVETIKHDSRAFICQRGHTNYITLKTLKKHKLHLQFFADIPKDADIEEEDDLEVEEMSVTAQKSKV
jgi:hypothetical protein